MPAENPTGKHTVDVCEKCGARRLPDEWNPPSIEIRESDAMHSCPYDDALNATDVIWEFFKAHPRTAAVKPIAKND